MIKSKALAWDVMALFLAYCTLSAAFTYFLQLPLLEYPFALKKALPHIGNLPKFQFYTVLGVVICVTVSLMANPFRRKDKDKYGGAHWATSQEIHEMGLLGKQEGMILGKRGNRYLRMDEPLSVLVIAPPGAGKTSGIIIPSVIAQDNSQIIFDPKGEIYQKTGPYREQFSKVYKFAPAEYGGASWNPLDANELPDSFADKVTYVDRLSASIWPVRSESSAHWDEKARKIFQFWALYLIDIKEKKGESTSLPEIYTKSASSGHFFNAIEEVLETKKIPDEVRFVGNGIISMADQERSSVISTYEKRMSVFLDPAIRSSFESSSFYLNQLRSETTTIYISVGNHDQDRLKELIAMIFNVITLRFITKEPEAHEKAITLYIDEFARLGKMQDVFNLPAISRSYRLNVVYVVQNVAQLEKIYDQKAFSQLRGSCAYTITFTVNDPQTADDFSRAIGNMTVKRKSVSGRHILDESKSISEEGIPLVRPQQLTSLSQGELIILRQGSFQTPVKARCAFYFKEPQLNKIVNKCLNPSRL